MKHLPEILNTSHYKYNIIDRLILLEGGISNLNEKKKELTKYLENQGVNQNTIRKWLVIERDTKTEIPFSVLSAIKDFFNEKYEELNGCEMEVLTEKIVADDLYNKGQLRIISN